MSVFNHSFGDGPMAVTPRYIHSIRMVSDS